MSRTKISVFSCVALFALAAYAYLPPVDEGCGVRVEIASFPQKADRPGKKPQAWPRGVTEVQAGSPRPFTVTLENTTGKTITGELVFDMTNDSTINRKEGVYAQ